MHHVKLVEQSVGFTVQDEAQHESDVETLVETGDIDDVKAACMSCGL
jgi:hypothetical protein